MPPAQCRDGGRIIIHDRQPAVDEDVRQTDADAPSAWERASTPPRRTSSPTLGPGPRPTRVHAAPRDVAALRGCQRELKRRPGPLARSGLAAELTKRPLERRRV